MQRAFQEAIHPGVSRLHGFRRVLAAAFVALASALMLVSCTEVADSEALTLSAVSSRADMVSGGDVLVRIDAHETIALDEIMVLANGEDVTSTFQALPDRRALLGLVEGLEPGENTLAAYNARTQTGGSAELTVMNHPITGPIFSGPKQDPFLCQTETFQLVTGETLGPAIDEHCSVASRVDYVYRTVDGDLRPLEQLDVLPDDVSEITTLEGVTVPHVVRVETGTINRAIYETAMLHNPVDEPDPDPWTPSHGWNGRLVYSFGGGCRTGWYSQGDNTGGVLDEFILGQGYAVASASLNVFGNNCDDLLAAETMMMVKEHFIERYGPPRFTIGWGCSGGSYQVHQIGDNYPGLLDGIIPGCSFPEVGFGTSIKLADSRLLDHYFTTADEEGGVTWSQEEQRSVAGFAVWESISNMSEGAARLDPVPTENRTSAEFKPVVPEELRYHPVSNPDGARPTVYDHAVNVYGVDPETGFARRPLDNVGLQYGLEALNSGEISIEQFLDLNERIGGLDIDANVVDERMVADPDATQAAYRTGRMLHGGNGLATLPIIDYRAYSDDLEGGDIHMIYHQFSTRSRLVNANGHADNHVMLIEDFSHGFYNTESAVLQEALLQMDEWLVNLEKDSSEVPQTAEVLRAKPESLVDACWTEGGEKITERLAYDASGRCSELYPAFPSPRMVAGGPLSSDVIKCALKPLDPDDYEIEFTDFQWSHLEDIFPEGVCDWTEPGQHQQPLATTWWAHGR